MAYNQAKKRKNNPCWKGYEMIGTKKMKRKKAVQNYKK